MAKITVSREQLVNLLVNHTAQKGKDNSVSDFIEIELIEATDIHNKADNLRFSAQSVYAECDNHFLQTNYA